MRILYISYFFPPLGGPAVIRNTKIVKYLARQGWEIDLITVKEIEYYYHDESLLQEIPALSIHRCNSLDPMALMRKLRPGKSKEPGKLYQNTPERLKLLIRRLHPIDDKVGWLPYLLAKGRSLMKEKVYDLIYVSCGPFSSAVGAYLLSKQSGVPLVYDARDYWNLLTDYDLQASALQRKLSLFWEKRVLEHSSLFVAATEGIRRDCTDFFGYTGESLTLYNGWDEEDFEGLEDTGNEAWELAYFGTLYARRSLKHFYTAVRRLREEGRLPEDTIIRIYGGFNREIKKEIDESGIGDIIEVLAPLPHREALGAMLKAAVLLLVINSSAPKGTLSSKVFEYLRTGKPILAMIPAQEEAAELLRSCEQDYICAMESSETIYSCLLRLIENRGKEPIYKIDPSFSREARIQKLHEALLRCIYS